MGEGLGAYLKELQKVSEAQEVGSRPGIERLLKHGGVWRLGTVGIRHKDSGQGYTVQDLRASLPEFIPPSWTSSDHPVLRGSPSPAGEMLKDRTLQPAIPQQERERVLLYYQPQEQCLAHSSCSILAC